MSDVSESLQVRTDADEICIERLRSIGFNGFAFRGGHGWLTIVPYGAPGSLAISNKQLAAFAAKLAVPVINFSVNDFSWSFSLALPDGRTTAFVRWLVNPMEFGMIADEAKVPILDDTVLSAVVPLGRVKKFLGPTELHDAKQSEWELFAQALGFPQFSQLNPTYTMDHPDEMRRMGGIEIGHRPQSMKGQTSP